MNTKGSYGQPFTPAEVGQVQPGSAAEQGGVRPGDVILSIDGSTVQRFEDIQQIVRPNAGVGVGVPMTIVVRWRTAWKSDPAWGVISVE